MQTQKQLRYKVKCSEHGARLLRSQKGVVQLYYAWVGLGGTIAAYVISNWESLSLHTAYENPSLQLLLQAASASVWC